MRWPRACISRTASLFENVACPEPPAGAAARFRQDGYLQGTADWGLDVALMADTVRALSAADLSPLFAFLYDEFWYPLFKLQLLHRALLGGSYRVLPDFWILDVDPKKNGAGMAAAPRQGQARLVRGRLAEIADHLDLRCRKRRRSTAAFTWCRRSTIRPMRPRTRAR